MYWLARWTKDGMEYVTSSNRLTTYRSDREQFRDSASAYRRLQALPKPLKRFFVTDHSGENDRTVSPKDPYRVAPLYRYKTIVEKPIIPMGYRAIGRAATENYVDRDWSAELGQWRKRYHQTPTMGTYDRILREIFSICGDRADRVSAVFTLSISLLGIPDKYVVEIERDAMTGKIDAGASSYAPMAMEKSRKRISFYWRWHRIAYHLAGGDLAQMDLWHWLANIVREMK